MLPTSNLLGVFVRATTLACVSALALSLNGCGWFSDQFAQRETVEEPVATQPLSPAPLSEDDLAALASAAAVAANSPANSAQPFYNSGANSRRGLMVETSQGVIPAPLAGQIGEAPRSRCVRLNNYWCIKTPTSGGFWEGQIGEDASGHAYFRDPVYSARAFARTIRSYYFRRNIRSVSGIINRYAPSSDCNGSLSYCPISANAFAQHGSITGTGRLGSSFVRYTNRRPSSGLFSRGTSCTQMLMYCPAGRNQTEDYARDVAQSMQRSSSSDLGLFDSVGRVHYQQMVTLMHAISKWEIGKEYVVDENLIREGLIMEVQDFRESDPSKWPGVQPSAFVQ